MTSASIKSASGPARRTVVAAAGAAGLSAALTACGGSDDDSSSSSSSAGTSGSSGSTGTAGAASTGGTGGGAAAGAALATTADIPEGGGKVFDAEKVVVTQPTAGTYKAFSAVCTHQGCAVKSIADGVINCPCHNSSFSITDGSVKGGPAQKPLPEVAITVTGDSITLA